MYLLDTDHLTPYFHYAESNPELVARANLELAAGRLFVPIIAVEEMVRGALQTLRDHEKKRDAPRGYLFFQRVITTTCALPLRPFDSAAEAIFRQFAPDVRRIGLRDCRIAAIALSEDLVVVTRNVRHFNQVPGLNIENWL